MNKRIILTLLVVFLVIFGLKSQQTFSKFYNVYKGTPYGNEYARSIAITEDGYCVDVSSICTTPEINGCGNLLFIDKIGNVLWKKNLTWFNDGDREALTQYKDTIYFVGTKDINHITEGDAYILKVNAKGDSLGLMHSFFQDSYNKWGQSVAIIYSNNYLYTISHHDAFNSQNMPELMKWDLSGNVIFDKVYYEEIGNVAYSYGLVSTRDSNIIIAYDYINKHNNLTSEILKADYRNGDVIWKKGYDTKNILTYTRVLELYDSTLIMSYVYQLQDLDSLLLQKFNGWPLRLVRLSKDGQKQLWQYQFDRKPYYVKFGLHHLIQAKNGDIIGVGGYGSVYLVDSTNYGSAWIFRMSQDGKLLWEHFYQDEEYPGKYGLLSVREDDDGSIVAVGEVTKKDSMNRQDHDYTWVLKVDSMGCLTPGCSQYDTIQYITSTVIDVPTSNIDVIVFPNPVDDILNVKANEGFEHFRWRIFDITGRLMKSGENNYKIDVSSFDQGMYYIQIQNKIGNKNYGKIAVKKFVKF